MTIRELEKDLDKTLKHCDRLIEENKRLRALYGLDLSWQLQYMRSLVLGQKGMQNGLQ